ncbi:MAG: polyphosphate kinase 2, partial [Microbacteriaceae bacterium]|nr:polyphosphate kinase 2 [Microbacteriaceae bacterium]
EAMFEETDKKYAPWVVVKSNDKKRGRINAMRAYLNQFEYEGKDDSVVYDPDPLIVSRAKHTPDARD